MSKRALFFALTIIWLFIGNIKVKAQEKAMPSWQIGTSYSRSFIIRHAPDIGHLITGSPEGFNIYFEKLPDGSKAWHQAYRFPLIGFSAGYFLLKNQTLGNVAYTSASLNLPIYVASLSSLRFKVASGLGFSTHPYHPENNNKNLIFGGATSFMLQANLDWNLRLTESLALRSGLMFTHFSNGAIKLPNKGINMAGFEVGLNYSFKSEAPIKEAHFEPTKPWTWTVQLSTGWSEPYMTAEKRFPFYHISTYGARRLGKFNAFTFGMDGFYNLSIKEKIRAEFEFRDKEKPDFKRWGLTIGHEFWLDKLALNIMLGRYLYEPYPAYTSFYQRYGLKYKFWKSAHVAINLKSHAGQAEGIEWGLGYGF